MADLSPAARAVHKAAWSAYWIKDAEAPQDAELIAAAALRAAALYCKRDRAQLVSLADELDPPSP